MLAVPYPDPAGTQRAGSDGARPGVRASSLVGQMNASRSRSKMAFGFAPTMLFTTSPPW